MHTGISLTSVHVFIFNPCPMTSQGLLVAMIFCFCNAEVRSNYDFSPVKHTSVKKEQTSGRSAAVYQVM